ncbi:hypothetical protein F3Y22_tig00110469pilonHSYRG00146 [Hibiscus syriacus]|uniref:Retrotransposon gag domain-containing protein n=1 Tax=Hibiscus syriacus TaxID=106335 RepID=A0A6A3AJN2_HIBSY|nr:hypothetical protein F3Y22_tig00110469pilonHSYRG00146 [Hibiscus syriacus]
MKEASDSVPDGLNQISQGMTSDKEEITDKEQPCYQESRMIIYPGESHSNPKNSFINYSQYEERFKRMDEAIRNMKGVNASHKELEARELSLVPDLVIPHKFKRPDFEKYDGTICPLIHLRMFCRKMEGYLNSNDLLIHSFHDSLTGPAIVWYNHLTQEYIKRWVDLVDAFLGEYRYVKGLAPTRINLQGVKMKANEGFKEYALRWRGVAAQVQPLMEFENLMTNGELIENVINKGNSKVTSKSPKDQNAKDDDVNECRIQSPRNGKRKRASQYITPRPMKMPPNSFAHSYDQYSVCDFHLGVLGHSTSNCRSLLKEIEMLVDKGVLTRKMIKKWGANKDEYPGISTHPTFKE